MPWVVLRRAHAALEAALSILERGLQVTHPDQELEEQALAVAHLAHYLRIHPVDLLLHAVAYGLMRMEN
jgi:hypothetical protein